LIDRRGKKPSLCFAQFRHPSFSHRCESRLRYFHLFTSVSVTTDLYVKIEFFFLQSDSLNCVEKTYVWILSVHLEEQIGIYARRGWERITTKDTLI
jgi:hypothetical protein